MKAISLVAVLFLVGGCASVKSVEQLELEATLTGDWSAVERRERLLARRDHSAAISCPTGYVSFCKTYGFRESCGCVSRQGMREIFAGR